MKTVKIIYYAMFREQAGRNGTTIQTDSETVSQLYEELKSQNSFSLPLNQVKFAINGTFQSSETLISDQDLVVFIPPVSGG